MPGHMHLGSLFLLNPNVVVYEFKYKNLNLYSLV